MPTMLLHDLIYCLGALADIIGALLIASGFARIKLKDIYELSTTYINNDFDHKQAESLLRQRIEGVIGGLFIVIGSLCMFIATLLPLARNGLFNDNVSFVCFLFYACLLCFFAALIWSIAIPKFVSCAIEEIMQKYANHDQR